MDAIPGIMDKLPGAEERSLGAILVETGRLRAEDAQAVLREQAASGGTFGTTAVRLGLLTEADVEFALARQFDYPYLPDDNGNGIVDASVVAACQPFSEVGERLRALRTQLSLRWLNARVGRKTLAVCGFARGEGRSFVAANLAVAFAQTGARTLLVDADLRHPAQHTLFRIDNRTGLSSVLAERAGPEAIVRIGALRNLFVLAAGPVPPNPQELLGRPQLTGQLRALETLFDVVIADTSAAGLAADGQIVAAASGASLLVARRDATPLEELRALRTLLDASGSQVLGAVVNR